MSVPPRTTVSAVEAVLGGQNENSNWDGVTDLTPFIQPASSLVDRVVTCALSRSPSITLSAVEQELIERWMSAHFYAMLDPIYQNKSSGGASGGFQRGHGGTTFEDFDYSRVACNMDYSGCLSAIGKRSFARFSWIGTEPLCTPPGETEDRGGPF